MSSAASFVAGNWEKSFLTLLQLGLKTLILCPTRLSHLLVKSVKDMLILLKVKTVLGTEILCSRSVLESCKMFF